MEPAMMNRYNRGIAKNGAFGKRALQSDYTRGYWSEFRGEFRGRITH